MILYHYCKNSALIGTITNRSIRLSDLSLSNDYMEGKWIKNVVRLACERRKMAEHHIVQIEKHGDFLSMSLGGLGYCLSKEPDLLSQWVAYADLGSGVAVGYDSEYFNKFGDAPAEDEPLYRLNEVIYDLEQQIDQTKETVDKIERLVNDGAFLYGGLLSSEEDRKRCQTARANLGRAMILLFPFLYTFKNPAFKEEKEWRLLSYRVKGEKGLKFQDRADRIAPYREFPIAQLDIPAIKEVWIGPKNGIPNEVIMELFEQNGFSGVEIKVSTASYR